MAGLAGDFPSSINHYSSYLAIVLLRSCTYAIRSMYTIIVLTALGCNAAAHQT
jgi:hypothetical protein